ncbi:hypothetical protein RhiirC2_791806 [Rhizophagus irregularis]|uniref:Uncharacterized protein n=1 Tax=Rhizophagus irregularis TaxID=588596 RepID=A0A2N1MIG7_9GLOM|nr:hypothetical protein RhiirC2_791806 [Rhizophagus irregularis]
MEMKNVPNVDHFEHYNKVNGSVYPVVQYCLRLYTDPSKWILIDWDNAVGFPNSSSNHLTTKDHALEAFNKNHRWQVSSNGQPFSDLNYDEESLDMNCKSNINNDSNDQDSKIGDNTDINDDLE